MVGRHHGKLRRFTARSALGALIALSTAPATQAQWLLPLGAAPPREIEQRLRAQGLALTGPLVRRNSVYLADVNGGPAGHERLIIDAWSGEILQRFVARRGHWRQRFGGEFAEPLPPGIVGPPPASEFFSNAPPHPSEERIRSAPKPKAAAASRQPAQTAPAEQAGSPATSPSLPQSTAAAPAAPATTANPSAPRPDAPSAPAEKPSGAPSSPDAKAAAASAPDAPSGAVAPEAPKPGAKPAAPGPAEQPRSGAAGEAQAQAAKEASPKPVVPVARAKPGEKSKPNDVPVMPLE